MSKRDLARLKRSLQMLGLTQHQVARAARVSTSNVSNVLAGRYTSTHVIATAQQLVARRQHALDGVLAKQLGPAAS
jgi:hypothetical protein